MLVRFFIRIVTFIIYLNPTYLWKITKWEGDSMDDKQTIDKIVLSEEIQKSMMKFFLKTSIPRKAKQERAEKSLLDMDMQGEK